MGALIVLPLICLFFDRRFRLCTTNFIHNISGHPVYLEASLQYYESSGKTLVTYDKCTLQYTALSPYNWGYSFLGLAAGLAAVVVAALGFRHPRRRLLCGCPGDQISDDDNDGGDRDDNSVAAAKDSPSPSTSPPTAPFVELADYSRVQHAVV